jgi:hypothetical protein
MKKGNFLAARPGLYANVKRRLHKRQVGTREMN